MTRTWGDADALWSDPRYTWTGDAYSVPSVPRTLSEILRGSHRPCTRLHWLDSAGAILRTWQGGVSRTAILTGGDTIRDRGRMVRGSGDLAIANPDGALTPQAPGDPFFGGERLRLEQGAYGDNGQPLWTVTFTGVVTGWSADMMGGLSVSVEDPTSLLAQPMGEAVSVPAGMSAEDALRLLWEPVLGDSDAWVLDGDGRSVSAGSWGADADRLAAGSELMAGLGLEVYADRLGRVVLQPVPDPTAQDLARTFTTSSRNATALGLARHGTRQPYNRVVVVVDDPARPTFHAVADVDEPGSPIHADAIGLRVAPVHRSALIPDQASANAVARALLGWYSRYADSVDGGFFPDPELLEGDVVSLTESITGTADRYLVESVTLPVVTGSMSLATSKVLPLFSDVTAAALVAA